MLSIETPPLPEHALLQRYARNGSFTDCYSIELPIPVTQRQYILAFYTGNLFKLERTVLALIGRSSSDTQAQLLAQGKTNDFAAWFVEDRLEQQLLLSDFRHRTRSWLMCTAIDDDRSRLYFGSAVVPQNIGNPGTARMGFIFHALSGVHALYSRALIKAAASKLLKEQ